MNAMEKAILAAAEHGASPKTWSVDPDADVEFGNGPSPFDQMQLTAWIDSFDAAARRNRQTA